MFSIPIARDLGADAEIVFHESLDRNATRGLAAEERPIRILGGGSDDYILTFRHTLRADGQDLNGRLRAALRSAWRAQLEGVPPRLRASRQML